MYGKPVESRCAMIDARADALPAKICVPSCGAMPWALSVRISVPSDLKTWPFWIKA